jgi:hypothetical protein
MPSGDAHGGRGMAGKNGLFDYGLTILSLLISGVLGVVTFNLSKQTDSYKQQVDQFEANNKKYTIISELLQKCTSDKKADENYLFFLKTNQGRFDLSSIAPTLQDSDGFRKAFQSTLQACFDWTSNGAGGATTTEASGGSATSGGVSKTQASGGSATSDSELKKEHWVYLGTYDGKWKTQYLSFPESFDPKTLAKSAQPGPILKVRDETGAVNLRSGQFGSNGSFPPITGTLSPGASVEILRTWQWRVGEGGPESNNWWAAVNVHR